MVSIWTAYVLFALGFIINCIQHLSTSRIVGGGQPTAAVPFREARDMHIVMVIVAIIGWCDPLYAMGKAIYLYDISRWRRIFVWACRVTNTAAANFMLLVNMLFSFPIVYCALMMNGPQRLRLMWLAANQIGYREVSDQSALIKFSN